MTSEAIPEEPDLPVLTRPRRLFRDRRRLVLFLPATSVAVVCLALLLISGNVFLPFDRVVTLTGAVGSEKVAFFQDPQVRKILMAHHIQVDVTATGSRDIATHDTSNYDFVLPSGLPAAKAVEDGEQKSGKYFRVFRPFVSPIVLATFRSYAEALVRAHVATVQRSGNDQPLYYDLDVDGFVDLIRAKTTWNSIAGMTGDDRILARTSDVCSSNSADSYLALVAFADNKDNVVADADQARRVAGEIKPLLSAQGQPDASTADRFTAYLTPDSRAHVPVIVAYEHQYLAYQIQQTVAGRPDTTRVLLYPKASFTTQPDFIALTPQAAQLGQLLTSDPDLRRRATELGFRIIGTTGPSDAPLLTYLHQIGMPTPANDSRQSVSLPDLGLFDQMIKTVGDCRD